MRIAIILCIVELLLFSCQSEVEEKNSYNITPEEANKIISEELSKLKIEINAFDRYHSLKGINKIHVLIEEIPLDGLQIGLKEKGLRSICEAQLNKWGIKAIGITELPSLVEVPVLYVIIKVYGDACSVLLSIREDVTLNRDPSLFAWADTWFVGITKTHKGNPKDIISALSYLLDIFINDYYMANPKKKD